MRAAIGLRKDFSAEALRVLARRTKDGPQARRLLALAHHVHRAARLGPSVLISAGWCQARGLLSRRAMK
jgi:hypothetical protein